MDNKYNRDNDASRERLKKLVNGMTAEELKLVIYSEGWTIAVALGHVAFWDGRRALWLKEYQKTGVMPDDTNAYDLTNDALVPLLLALNPRTAAGLCIASAEKVDKIIAGLSPEWVKKLEGCGDKYAMDRAKHRTMHLDEIDVLLAAKRGSK